MSTNQQPGDKPKNRSVAELIEDIQFLTTEIQELYCSDDIPWIVGVSWGKDSFCVLQPGWNAIAAFNLIDNFIVK